MVLQFFKYKPDQGRFSRGLAFWLITGLSFFGCRTLYFFLQRWNWAQDNFLEDPIPIINTALSPALIISVALFLLFELIILKMIVNRPKVSDLLIETETEMKKVTWPSWNDAFNSSLVVLIAVIFFMILLGLSDFFLNQVFSRFIFGMTS